MCYLENWRPISLLNVDYKIATKTVANRIKLVLPSIISHQQTGFIKDRYIGENIRLLFDVLEYVDENELSSLLFFSDFEKAFDSLDHQFMIRCLKHFNFENTFIKWINLFYNNSTSCTINNGHLSDFFPFFIYFFFFFFYVTVFFFFFFKWLLSPISLVKGVLEAFNLPFPQNGYTYFHLERLARDSISTKNILEMSQLY